MFVKNCLLHPHPADDDLDPVGHALRDLSSAVDAIQKVDPRRLLGDRLLIDSAALALMMVRRRIDEIEGALQAAE